MAQMEVVFANCRQEMVGALQKWSGDAAAAEDAVQQAFLRGLQHSDLLEAMPENAARAWLYTTARRALIDQKRREQRLISSMETEQAADIPDPVDAVLAAQLMATLAPEQRTLVHMRYFTGLNASQIGQSLGIPAATVRTRLRAALKTMRDKAESPK